MRRRILAVLAAAFGLAIVCLLYQPLAIEAKCRSVKPGMTYEEAGEILGPPNAVFGSGFSISIHRRGEFLSVVVVVSYDEDNKVTGATVTHHLGTVCIEDKLGLLKATPSPPSAQ